MAVDWKGAAPLIALLFAIAALIAASGGTAVIFNSFVGAIVVAALWLLIIPLINQVAGKKQANVWFIRAAAFAIFAAAFTLVPAMIQGPTSAVGTWPEIIAQVGFIFSWIFGFIGALSLLGKK